MCYYFNKGVDFMIYHFFCKKCNNSLVYNDESQTKKICRCKFCGHDNKILDISYKDNESAPLSNLFPHKFGVDGVTCQSMESFIQSLRVENEMIQRQICQNYSGYMAYKMRLSLPDWRKTGYVYWRGRKILRDSKEYDELMTKAYYELCSQNFVFRYCLYNHKDEILFHTIGCTDKTETLLTQQEYISQLEKLIELFELQNYIRVF